VVSLSIAPMFIDIRWLLVIKAVRGPLRAGNAEPTRLIRKLQINRFISRMNYDLRFGLSFLQSSHAADMVHVRMRAGDGLQLESMLVDRLDDRVGIITGIDKHGFELQAIACTH